MILIFETDIFALPAYPYMLRCFQQMVHASIALMYNVLHVQNKLITLHLPIEGIAININTFSSTESSVMFVNDCRVKYAFLLTEKM